MVIAPFVRLLGKYPVARTIAEKSDRPLYVGHRSNQSAWRKYYRVGAWSYYGASIGWTGDSAGDRDYLPEVCCGWKCDIGGSGGIIQPEVGVRIGTADDRPA
jgi:hypothetical protein